MSDSDIGVVFPPTEQGARSTTAFGRQVVAAALKRVDGDAADAAAREKDWRGGYLEHFRRMVEVGVPSPEAASTVASDGLGALHGQMHFRRDDTEGPLATAFDAPGGDELDTVVVDGATSRQGPAELVVPYHGERLSGDALHRQLDRWVEHGIVEPSFAAAIGDVARNPDWLDLSDWRLVVVGAGAEMGPLQSFMRWGADVAAVDLPRPEIWERVVRVAREGTGRLRVPVRGSAAGRDDVAAVAGADLLTELPEVSRWISGLDGRLVLGNYVYADGALNVRVAMAVDALTEQLLAERPDTALAVLATPTDVFAVPEDVVAEARRRGKGALLGRVSRGPLRAVSAGKLFRPQYPSTIPLAGGGEMGISDCLVAQQGPNYALAKRLQRWRATVASEAGVLTSLNVAPPTRTRSVVKNRLLAAAYAGAHRFGIEVFQPATSNTLMAALLVHDLRTAGRPVGHPFDLEIAAAAHGGLWRQPYDARSVLGLAVLLGMLGARA